MDKDHLYLQPVITEDTLNNPLKLQGIDEDYKQVMLGKTFFTLRGKEWAENRMITSLRISSGNVSSSEEIRSANTLASLRFVPQRSIILQVMPFGKFLKNEHFCHELKSW